MVARDVIECIEHLRREKNPFATMIGGVRGELAFGQFENGFVRIVEIECSLNLEKDALTIIRHPAIGEHRIAPYTDMNLCRTRMVDRDVDHLGHAIVPGVAHILLKPTADSNYKLATRSEVFPKLTIRS